MVDYKDLYVVGIGSSAGGFEAFQKFLPRLPTSDRITYIIAQHLDPARPTLFGDLLSKYSSFNITPVVDGQKVEGGTICYSPPSKDVTIVDGCFRLTDPEVKSYPKPSVNKLFTSLAKEKKEKAVGIILSGTGSDGAMGISEISKHGGITLTEDEGAKYYSMPKAAIDTGHVIASLPPELLAEGIEHIIEDRQYFEKHFELKDSVSTIFNLLNKKTKVDFSSYKEATITRRIKKRMNETKSFNVDDYVELLQNDEEEIIRLKDELLIIVTSFFRDKEAFSQLKVHLKELLENKMDDHVRIWVTACATGEEAYSIAIIMSELLEEMKIVKKITIFATDISEDVVSKSRNKSYLEEQIDGISPEHLEKYFEPVNNSYKPKTSIREMIIFSQHDLIKDPPFLNMDLISCRNVLIYFDNELQKRLLSIFYYSLRYDSLLFLGKSETVGSLSALFSIEDNKAKIYKKANDIGEIDIDILTYVKRNNNSRRATKRETESEQAINVDNSINQAVSNIFGLNGVVIDRNGNILYYKGDCRDYIMQPQGIHTNDIYRLAVDYIKLDLRAIINLSRKNRVYEVSKKIRIMPTREPKEYVTISIFPLEKNRFGEETYFITFEKEVDQALSLPSDVFEPIDFNQTEASMLEDELVTLKERLQITIEELETSNEELQSTNEELQSTNEEFQSTNEELETSNEELQSTNEELQTVNDELNFSNLELELANIAFNKVLRGLNSYVVILDTKLNIVKYTDGIELFFDIGKSANNNFSTILLNSNFYKPNLMDDIKQCLYNDESITYEIIHGNRNFSFSIKKFSYGNNKLKSEIEDGLVLSFVDNTESIKKDKMIFQQSKMAAMGEMIGNIAHQWRQPLNTLNALNMKLESEFNNGELDNDSFAEFKNKSNTLIQNMSSTIDDFRSFFSPNKLKENFYIDKLIKETIDFIEDSFKHNKITIVNSITKDIQLYSYKNELMQVILNLLTNSKDAFLINKITDPKITIEHLDTDEEHVGIAIYDNGGGISSSIIDKVFEPYFTTRFQSGGTGIGLYMSKMMIQESMHGTLTLENYNNGTLAKIIISKRLNI